MSYIDEINSTNYNEKGKNTVEELDEYIGDKNKKNL